MGAARGRVVSCSEYNGQWNGIRSKASVFTNAQIHTIVMIHWIFESELLTTNTSSHHCKLQYNIHYTASYYTTLHYITLHYTTLHFSTLHYIKIHCTTPLNTTLHYTSLHYTALHHSTLHYITLHYIKIHCTTPLNTALHYTTLH